MNIKPLIALLAIVIILAGGTYWYLRNDRTVSPLSHTEFLNDFKTQTVDHIGLAFQIPSDMTFDQDGSVEGEIKKIVFQVQKANEGKPNYLLYGVYQFQTTREANQSDIDRWKTEMDPSTVKNTTLGPYAGIEGLIQGVDPRYASGSTRYVKVILKDGALLSISTLPPTQENKELTEKILTTFVFTK